jgi:hypothetical protein
LRLGGLADDRAEPGEDMECVDGPPRVDGYHGRLLAMRACEQVRCGVAPSRCRQDRGDRQAHGPQPRPDTAPRNAGAGDGQGLGPAPSTRSGRRRVRPQRRRVRDLHRGERADDCGGERRVTLEFVPHLSTLRADRDVRSIGGGLRDAPPSSKARKLPVSGQVVIAIPGSQESAPLARGRRRAGESDRADARVRLRTRSKLSLRQT